MKIKGKSLKIQDNENWTWDNVTRNFFQVQSERSFSQKAKDKHSYSRRNAPTSNLKHRLTL